MNENKFFNNILSTHKQDISKIGKIKYPTEDIKLLNRIQKHSLWLALFYADFKCEKCKAEKELTQHHCVLRKVKDITNINKYLAVRNYWFNTIILCKNCHMCYHEMWDDNPDNFGTITQKRINIIKKKFGVKI